MKIDSCLIVRDEEINIEPLIKQLLIFSNEIHITDTGSKDKTIEIVKNISIEHPNVFLHQFEWVYDFSKARNYSLTCYECHADYQFWCDADDELNDKLIETFLKFKKSTDQNKDIYHIKYKYYEGDTILHWRTSLLRVEKHLEWVDPIHEFINYKEYSSENPALDWTYFNNGSMLIHHKIDMIDHQRRNLEIFMNMEKTKYKFSCRNRFYYGRELYSQGLVEYSIYQLHKCIDHEEPNPVDKINSAILLFVANDPEALDYCLKLIKIGFVRKDLFFILGNFYYNAGAYEMARMYYMSCINFGEPNVVLLFNYDPACHLNSLGCLGMIENNIFGNVNNAIYYFNEILKIDPSNKVANDNIKILNESLKQNQKQQIK